MPIADDYAEALRDGIEPVASSGDSDTGTAMLAYRVERPTLVYGVELPAGYYVREVTGNRVLAYEVPASEWAAVLGYIENENQRQEVTE